MSTNTLNVVVGVRTKNWVTKAKKRETHRKINRFLCSKLPSSYVTQKDSDP